MNKSSLLMAAVLAAMPTVNAFLEREQDVTTSSNSFFAEAPSLEASAGDREGKALQAEFYTNTTSTVTITFIIFVYILIPILCIVGIVVTILCVVRHVNRRR